MYEPGEMCNSSVADEVRYPSRVSVKPDMAPWVLTAQGLCSSSQTKAAKLKLQVLGSERTSRVIISMRERRGVPMARNPTPCPATQGTRQSLGTQAGV